MSLTLCIDFDGTLVEEHSEPLQLVPGAAQALEAIKAAGHRLVLHSCRCNPMDPTPVLDDEVARWYAAGEVPARVTYKWNLYTTMRQFLLERGLWSLFDEVWQAPGKPIANIYVDDRAELPKWTTLVLEFGGAT